MQLQYKKIKIGLDYQAGFTLIELMVALILGTLIGAAALQILLTSSRNEAAQAAASQIQDDGTFGLQMMRNKLLLANLGARTYKPTPTSKGFNSQYTVTDRTRQGGLVLTVPNIDGGIAKDENNLARLKYKTAAIPASILSHDGSSTELPDTQKASNLQDTTSDQLTIQYQAPYDMSNCEGENVKVGQYVIERYFLRIAGDDIALACTAAIYDLPTTGDADIETYKTYASYNLGSAATPGTANGTKKNDLTSNGTVILPRVESFQVQLGVTDKDKFATDPSKLSIRYLTIAEYRSLTTSPKPRIVSIKTALLVRSANNPGTGPEISELSFDILNEKSKKLKADSDNQLRNLYTSTVLIRNGRGNS